MCVVVGGLGAAESAISGNAEGVVTGLEIASYGTENIYDSFFN